MKIELVSKQFHKFAGRIHKKGEHLFATPAEARILKALGRAVPIDAAAAPAEAKAKRAYKKRAVAVPAEVSTAVPAMATTEPVADIAPAVAAPVPKSLVEELTKVKDEFRRRFSSDPAPDVPRETLTRPKAKTQE